MILCAPIWEGKGAIVLHMGHKSEQGRKGEKMLLVGSMSSFNKK